MDEEKYSRICELFKLLPDPRHARGRRYSWGMLMSVLVLAMVSGQRSIRAMGQWAKFHRAVLYKYLRPLRGEMPSESTLGRVARSVSLEALEPFVAKWAAALDEPRRDGHPIGVAMDGKEARGVRAHGEPAYFLSLARHGTGSVLGQLKVRDKSNEIVAAPQLLRGRDLRGMVITMDALLTQRDIAQQIIDQDGDYLMVVKGNQPKMLEAIDVLFSQPPWLAQERHAEYWTCASQTKGHGRCDTRTLEASTALNTYLEWPGLAQVLRRCCRRVNLRTGAITEETTYGLTSLPPERANVAQLETYWRGHWTIENRVHYVRDVTLGEDAAQNHSGSAPQALAALRNLVISLIRSQGWTYIPDGLRHYAVSPVRSLRLLAHAALRL